MVEVSSISSSNGESRVKVLYIVGYPRSGSTILGNLLGELEGFFHAGEIHYLWERNLLLGRRPCGCRAPIAQCEVWSDVLQGRASLPEPEDVFAWQSDAVRGRHMTRLLRLTKGKSGRAPLDSYREVLTRLYRGLAETTGARVIVDSSKWTSDAAVVASLDGIEPYFLHLIRDPRGVVYSRQRRIMRRADTRRARMRPLRLLQDAAGWTTTNLTAEVVCRRAGEDRSRRVIYEDFVESPQRVLQSIATMVNEDPPAYPFVRDRLARVGVHHTAGGNRVRFAAGEILIRQDVRWLHDLSARDRVLTSALTMPLLLRYGYRWSSSAAGLPTGRGDREVGEVAEGGGR
jgi:hypothetical protein